MKKTHIFKQFCLLIFFSEQTAENIESTIKEAVVADASEDSGVFAAAGVSINIECLSTVATVVVDNIGDYL